MLQPVVVSIQRMTARAVSMISGSLGQLAFVVEIYRWVPPAERVYQDVRQRTTDPQSARCPTWPARKEAA